MKEFANTTEYLSEEEFSLEEKPNWKEKLEKFLESRYFVAVCLVLVAIISFALGRVSKIQEAREPVRVVNNSFPTPINSPPSPPYIKGETAQTNPVSNVEQTASVQNAVTNSNSAESVVASKNGTKYHYPWCAGAKQIAEKNKITFNSIEEARTKGYTPASNCKGLK